MVAALFDTSVFIDLLRQYPPAKQWFAQQADLGASIYVWMEAIEGARSKPDQEYALKTLAKYPMIDTSAADANWALQQLIRLRLSIQVQASDCLIASASYRLQVPLYTTNLKHMTPILGSLAVRPYS